MMLYQHESIIGTIEVEVNDGLVYDIHISDGVVKNSSLEIDEWFSLFFSGKDPGSFPYKLADIGTEFEKTLRKNLLTVGYGKLVSYGELSKMISPRMSNRAVGHGLNRNPFMIVVPCHRVIGKDGSLTGFGAGLERKKILLELEGHTVVNDKVKDF